MAHTLALSAGRQETQIILTADYADETDFQNVLIQICVIRKIRGQYFGVFCCAAKWKIAPICWWLDRKQIKSAVFSRARQ